jgi:hypothetical protein
MLLFLALVVILLLSLWYDYKVVAGFTIIAGICLLLFSKKTSKELYSMDEVRDKVEKIMNQSKV